MNYDYHYGRVTEQWVKALVGFCSHKNSWQLEEQKASPSGVIPLITGLQLGLTIYQ